MTPIADIVNGYVIEPDSFMPNNMDLEDIKDWLSNQMSGGSAT